MQGWYNTTQPEKNEDPCARTTMRRFSVFRVQDYVRSPCEETMAISAQEQGPRAVSLPH